MTRRPITLALASLLLAGPTLTACSSGSSADADPDAPSVSTTEGAVAEAAPAPGAELDAAGFAAALKREGTVLVDVRTPEEYAEGHLPGAVNLDVQSPEFPALIAELDPETTYAVYCRSGNRSAAALAMMSQAGIAQTYHLGGGIGAWQEAGGDVVTS